MRVLRLLLLAAAGGSTPRSDEPVAPELGPCGVASLAAARAVVREVVFVA